MPILAGLVTLLLIRKSMHNALVQSMGITQIALNRPVSPI
jgi:DNA-binding Xre family transcriptional regulator